MDEFETGDFMAQRAVAYCQRKMLEDKCVPKEEGNQKRKYKAMHGRTFSAEVEGRCQIGGMCKLEKRG